MNILSRKIKFIKDCSSRLKHSVVISTVLAPPVISLLFYIILYRQWPSWSFVAGSMLLHTCFHLPIYISIIKVTFDFLQGKRSFRRRCFFQRNSTKNLEELLLQAEKVVFTNWTTIEQSGKFYLKDFCRSLEKRFKDRKIELFLAGSAGEQLGKPICSDLYNFTTVLMTDFDYMVYLKDTFAVTNIDKDSKIHIQTRDKDILPGYAKLYEIPNSPSIFPTLENRALCAGSLMKELYEILGNTDISFYPGFQHYSCYCIPTGQFVDFEQNGPALSLKIKTFSGEKIDYLTASTNGFLADIVFSIFCPEWPEVSDWPTRTERNWPLASDMETITKNGCHLIPKSQPNDTKKITWRFSFSNAEVQLSKLINPVARKCFLGLKIIAKRYLQPMCKEFKSYHIKTILYYTLEKTPLSFWREENIKRCFQRLLDELLHTLYKKRCPHFWISDINLYSGIKKSSLKTLHRKVLKMRGNPASYVKDIDRTCIGLTTGMLSPKMWLCHCCNKHVEESLNIHEETQEEIIIVEQSFSENDKLLA